MNGFRRRMPFALLMTLATAAGFVLLAGQLLALGEYHAAQAAGPEIAAASTFAAAQRGSEDARLAKAYRFERGGWIYVHLEGSPHDIGYQHGFLLATGNCGCVYGGEPGNDA